jgi:hypothetical protein
VISVIDDLVATNRTNRWGFYELLGSEKEYGGISAVYLQVKHNCPPIAFPPVEAQQGKRVYFKNF